jgi:hypothetical protein
MTKNPLAHCAATALLAWATPCWAQEGEAPLAQTPPAQAAPAADSDTAQTVALPSADEKIDVAAIPMPALAFTADVKFEKDFDKYYYFHRAETDFKTALADLRDCDGLSRGLASPFGYMETPYPYAGTLAGAAGGAIANLMVAAIFGSAQVRATRRVNMRRCMSFKGYERYGLPKDMWQEFNFEEGFSSLEEGKRQAYLKQQAKVASGEAPKTEALGK